MSDFADDPVTPQGSQDFAPAPVKATDLSGDFAPKPLTVLGGEAPAGYERTETGLQPAGLIVPPEPDPNSVHEDIRRAGEWLDERPAKALHSAIRTFEHVSDIPFTHLFSRQQMGDQNAMKDWAAKEGGPGIPEPTPVIPGLDLTPFNPAPGKDDRGNPQGEGSSYGFIRGAEETPNLDVGIPGTDLSARQVANIASHKTIGRAWKAFQRGPGSDFADMMYAATKDTQGAPINVPVGSWDPYEGDPQEPLTPGHKNVGVGPEADRMLSKELLSFFHGPDWHADENNPDTRKAVEDLQNQYGINGAAFAQSFAREVGGVPAFLVATGAGELAASPWRAEVSAISELGPQAMAKALPRAVSAGRTGELVAGTGEGMTQGYLQAAAQDGQDVFEGAGMGGFVGGTFGVVAAMASAKGTLAQLHHGLMGGPVTGMVSKQGGGMMLSPSSTREFTKQLDDVIAKVKASGPAKVDPGANLRKAQKTFEGNTGYGSRNTPDFDLEVVAGDPVHPTGSHWAITDQGLVMRDIEVVSQYVKNTKSNKTNTVKVETKPLLATQPEAAKAAREAGKKSERTNPRLTEVRSGENSGKLNVRVKVRDTPVKDVDAIQRLALQEGRRVIPGAGSDEAEAMVFTAVRNHELATGEHDAGGTAEYMPPEIGREYVNIERQNEALVRLQDRAQTPRKPGPRDNQPTKLGKRALGQTLVSPVPTVITASPEGQMTITAIRASPPKQPHDWSMEGGDTVLIDGEAPATVIGMDPSGVTVELTTPSKPRVKVPAASVTHVPREFVAPTHGGDPLLSVEPDKMVDDRTLAIIKGTSQGTTIPKLMQVSGRNDPTWAAEVLRQLEAHGVLKETEPGLFVPVRTMKGKFTTAEGESAGYAVYLGTGGAMGKGEIGVLRGKDPRSPGNWLVERPDFKYGTVPHSTAGDVYNKTVIESVPEKDIRTMKPVGFSDKDYAANHVNLEGWNKPMPPQYYQASKATQGDIEVLSKMFSKLEQQPGWVSRSWQGVKEAIAGAMHTAPVDLRLTKGQQLWGMAGMVRSEGMTRAKLLADKLELGSAASRDFTKVMEAKRARNPNGTVELNHQELQTWATNYPEEAKSALDAFKRQIAESDEYSAFLVQRGVTNLNDLQHARNAGLLDEYLTRNYQAFMMPRAKWAEYAKKNMQAEWADAVAWLTEHRPASEFSNPASELDDLLRLDNPIQALEDKGYIKAEGTKKLISRERVPAPFRALLGEHRDAAVKLGFTVAYQRQLVKGIQAWDDIAAHPALWSPGWRPDMSLKVPDQPIFGNARGGYLPDNAATRSLLGDRKLTSGAEAPAALRAIGWLGQKWKATHTVYNQVSWVNNAVRNLKGVLTSGGFQTPADFQAFRDAARMLMDYHKDPTIYGANKLLVEAMDYDAVGPGLAGSELQLEQRHFANKMLRVLNKARTGPTPFYDALAEVQDAAMSVPEKIHNGYDFVDKWSKFGSYLNIRRRLIAEGYSVDEAAQRSALEVNKRFQNFQRTPEYAKKVAGNFSIAAPFLSSKLEDIRINATLVGDALQALSDPKADKDLLFRLAGVSAMFGGMAYMANNARRANGITDADDDNQRSNIPLRSKEKHPFLVGSLSYDQHGRRSFADLTPYEDLASSFKGNLNDPLAARILFNNAIDVLGTDSFMGNMTEAFGAQTGLIHPTNPPSVPRPDQQGALDTIGKYGPGFVPQGLMNVLRASDKTAPSGHLINQDAFTPDQALASGLMGQPKVIVGPQSHKQTAMETAREVNRYGNDVGKAALDAALHGVSGDRLKYMIKSNVRELKKSVNIPRPLKTKTKE